MGHSISQLNRSSILHASSAPKKGEERRVAELRAELKRPGIVIVPGVYDVISALLVQSMGFKAAYVSGAAVTASLGLPDLGLITMDEMVRVVRYIASSVDIPLIVDIDTGYGEALNVVRAVVEFERAGAAGVQIEDQVLPKKCGHLSGKHVVPPDEMAKKIKAAAEARRNPDFVIVARTDARGVTGLEDAIERAQLYLEAGADVIFPEALESEAEFAEFARRIKAPLLANMTEFGKSPLMPAKRLEELGYKFVIYPVTLLRVALGAMREALRTISELGTQEPLLSKMMTRKELYELIGYYDYEKFDSRISEIIDKAVSFKIRAR
ncbi:methylisocitrate lyase [Thermoproteus tenax]|uniref:Methylisocitrate lyase n=1 Tax=Thermoproteus tenax (strain ATCC 35583 / DSM 2078 / JCM 9277 / NBRC 100435 / Kra 1) TaxID=768679 RepID=G4RKN1_THETK|nr:carboxyphosphonoenolpyruvate phosphonomutase [Thermoproteus tenax Kra 1]